MSAADLLLSDRVRMLASPGQRSWWSGRGASYALAEAIAASLRGFGADAVAVPREEARGRQPVGFVSRSGIGTPAGAAFLVTEAESSGALQVTGPPPVDAWWPGSWQRQVVKAWGRLLGLQVPTTTPPTTSRTPVVVSTAGWRALAALSDAAVSKLGYAPFVASSAGEFGHGLHARISQDPSRWSVWLLDDTPSIEGWLRRYAARTEVVPLSAQVHAAVASLRAFDLVLQHIGDAHGRPTLPATADHLRSAS